MGKRTRDWLNELKQICGENEAIILTINDKDINDEDINDEDINDTFNISRDMMCGFRCNSKVARAPAMKPNVCA